MKAARFDESVFDQLADESGGDLVSVFLPTHRRGREIAQDRIHLKNQLSAAEESLADLGYKPRQREERLHQAQLLLEDHEFWEHQSSGLAVFIDESGAATAVSSSKPLDPFHVVMPVFMLRPLLADVDVPAVPVLVLTREAVSLFTAPAAGEVEPMEADLPSFDDVNWFVDREPQRQQHPDQVGTDRSRHGHEPSSRADEDLARFLREVDSALTDFETERPLVVLGDDHIVARFAKHSERATSSPSNSGMKAPFKTEDVSDKVKTVLAELNQERVEAAMTEAVDRLGEGRATSDIEVALPAAITGRIEAVVSHLGAEPLWGRLDQANHEVETHDRQQPGDVDLLDRLVVWSRSNGARLTPAEIEIDGNSFVATLRY